MVGRDSNTTYCCRVCGETSMSVDQMNGVCDDCMTTCPGCGTDVAPDAGAATNGDRVLCYDCAPDDEEGEP